MKINRLLLPLVALLMLVTGAQPVMAATVVDFSGDPLPACGTYQDIKTDFTAYSDWQRTLLDTIYMVPSSYAPPDLVSTSTAGISGSGNVRRLAIDDLRAMTAAAKAAGAPIAVQSSYRSYSTQKSLFQNYVNRDGWADAVTYSARPGHSEHQLGTAIDFKSYGGKAPWSYTDWATTKAGAWMMANAHKYGFVLSYPKGKTSLTCYIYESWHYRYFGRAQAADMYASGLTTREYLWLRQN